jgi:hypothetical protein
MNKKKSFFDEWKEPNNNDAMDAVMDRMIHDFHIVKNYYNKNTRPLPYN